MLNMVRLSISRLFLYLKDVVDHLCGRCLNFNDGGWVGGGGVFCFCCCLKELAFSKQVLSNRRDQTIMKPCS